MLQGAGQISAFDLRGKHLWSRAVRPNYKMVALHTDSVDLWDVTYSMSGLQVGEYRRRSTAFAGGDRVLISAKSEPLQVLARYVGDTTHFIQLAFASNGPEVVLGNGYTYALSRVNAAGTRWRAFGPTVPILWPTDEEVEAEVAHEVKQATRPFKLPDGRFRTNPVPTAQIRERAERPRAYFSAFRSGLQMDAVSGDAMVVETHDDTVRVVRFHAGESISASIPCDGREGRSAISWPFMALICAGPDADSPELRLYRLSMAP